MDIELLVVSDCPHTAPARDLLRQALADVGLPHQGFTTREVSTPGQAAELGFTGSPTILIDGRDPFAEAGRKTGLACRVYRGSDGALAGVPGLVDLRRALKQVADPGPSRS
jgi:hypothetical protein